jgi:transcriptional regulator with XRE-family HTH domain
VRVEIAERFGDNLIRLRHAAALSQEELAHRAELDRTAISKYEAGDRLPRIDAFVKLAGALAATPESLLEGIGWEPTIRSGAFKVAKSKK